MLALQCSSSRVVPSATTTIIVTHCPRVCGRSTLAFVMSKRPAASSIVNPYLKQPSLASTSTSASSTTSGNSCSIANPYAKKREAPSSPTAASASGTRSSSPIDLTSSPEASPVSKKRKAAEPSATRSGEKAPRTTQQYKIYCDLDGVLVDFDAGIQRATGSKPDRLPTHILWAKVASIPKRDERRQGAMGCHQACES